MPQTLIFSDKELMGLYMALKKREDGLDYTMCRLLGRLESFLYEKLTIEELENIEDSYRNRIDIENGRS